MIKGKLCDCADFLSSHATQIWSLDGDSDILSTHLVIVEDASKENVFRINRECKELLTTVSCSFITIEVEYPSEGCVDDIFFFSCVNTIGDDKLSKFKSNISRPSCFIKSSRTIVSNFFARQGGYQNPQYHIIE